MTPKELSREALRRILTNPESWDQSHWHCETTHCYAGIIDFILAESFPERKESQDLLNPANYVGLSGFLSYDVQEILGLDDEDWDLITDPNNSFADLVFCHNTLFDDGVF